MPVLGHEFAFRDSPLRITVCSPDKSNVMGLSEKDNVLRDKYSKNDLHILGGT